MNTKTLEEEIERLRGEIEELRLKNIRADMEIASLLAAIKRSSKNLEMLKQEGMLIKGLEPVKKKENKAETKFKSQVKNKVMKIEISNAGYSMVIEEMPKTDIYSRRGK